MDAIPGIPLFRARPNVRSRSGRPPGPYVRRLSPAEVGCGRREEAHLPCPFEMFVRAGLPLAECVVLGERAHREFLEHSGLKEDLRIHISPSGEDTGSRTLRVRLSHMSSPIGGELNRQICEALMTLGAASVAVASESLIQRHLKSIPEVKDAIKKAWLSLEGLERQLEAASRGLEIPTWPVLILAEEG